MNNGINQLDRMFLHSHGVTKKKFIKCFLGLQGPKIVIWDRNKHFILSHHPEFPHRKIFIGLFLIFCLRSPCSRLYIEGKYRFQGESTGLIKIFLCGNSGWCESIKCLFRSHMTILGPQSPRETLKKFFLGHPKPMEKHAIQLIYTVYKNKSRSL